MKFPNDLDLQNLSREQVINLLLASIGFEELALAYLVKSEADLLQIALGKQTVKSNEKNFPMVDSIDDLLRINRSVNNTLKTITKKEKILLAMLKEVASLMQEVPVAENFCSATVGTGAAVINAAYFNEKNIDFAVAVDKIDLSIGKNCTLENDRIDMRLSAKACPFATITLVDDTARILCNPKFNTALISATVVVNAAKKQFDGEYQALISVNQDGKMTIFLKNERNRILFRITGTDAEVTRCGELEPANLCECSVNISTNQNTDITITPDNVFFPGKIQAVYIVTPCNCNAENSTLSLLIRYVIGGIGIEGLFVEGTISTSCAGNDAMIQGTVDLGGTFYNLFVQANRDGAVTATFEGASIFTITLSGATVVIGECNIASS